MLIQTLNKELLNINHIYAFSIRQIDQSKDLFQDLSQNQSINQSLQKNLKDSFYVIAHLNDLIR